MRNFELNVNGDYVRISPGELLFQDSSVYYDKNWFTAEVSVKVAAYSCIFNAELFSVDVELFKQGLRRCQNNYNDIATYNCNNGHINIEVKGDGIGHFVANCRISDDGGISRNLEFELEFDQTYLPKMIDDLNEITKEFPAVGPNGI